MTVTVFAIGLSAGLLGSCELGYWLGRRARAGQDQARIAHVTTWQNEVLAMLALLVGFSFAMAVARFDTRKELVVAETNAIGTTYLRTRLLDEPAGEELRALLRRYVKARLAFYDAGRHLDRIAAAEREAASLQQAIWSRVVTAGRADPQSELSSLLIESTNEMIDVDTKRLAALENKVPITVFVLLVLVAAVGVVLIGYACGYDGRRLPFGMIVVPILIAIVVVMVFDIAHPRLGLVRSGQQSLIRLSQSL
jgi:hypothetical protein